MDYRINDGQVRAEDLSRAIVERNALRWSIAVCERWMGEEEVDDL